MASRSGANRRTFLRGVSAVPAAALLSGAAPATLEGVPQPPPSDAAGRIIEAVEIVKVTGQLEVSPRQFNVTPFHLYDGRRPAPYRDDPAAKRVRQRRTHNYVRVRTRNGIAGLYGYCDNEAVTPILNQLGRVLIGQDALAVEKLWDEMYRSNRHARASHFMMAISQLDCALWDWRGQYYKAPVYALLGGPTRDPVKVYGSCLGFPIAPEPMAKRCAALRAQGFDHQKWFFATGPGDGIEGLNRAIDMVGTLRAAIGRDGEVMFDAFQGWDLQFARRWASAVEPHRPYWIEEAFPAADLESFIALSRLTTIPVATGEHFYQRWEVQQYLKAGAAAIIQADPDWCGGVSELVKICHLASVYGAKVIPHGHNIHAALHVVASQSREVCPLVEFLILHMPEKLHFQKNPLLTDNGWLRLPTAPGFGIELDESKIESREVLKAVT